MLSLALATGLCGVALGGWSVGPQSSHPGSSFRHKPSISVTLREDTLRPFPSHRMVASSSLLRTWRGGTLVAYPYLISTSSTPPRGTRSSATEPLLGPHSS